VVIRSVGLGAINFRKGIMVKQFLARPDADEDAIFSRLRLLGIGIGIGVSSTSTAYALQWRG